MLKFLLFGFFICAFSLVASAGPRPPFDKYDRPHTYKNPSAILYVNTTGREKIRVVLNRDLASEGNSEIFFRDIVPGIYTLVIYQYKLNRKTNQSGFVQIYNRTIYLDKDMQYEYLISRNGKIFSDAFSNYELDNGETNNDWKDRDYNSYNAASQEEFKNIKQAVSNAFTDADKISTAKAIIKNYMLTSTQIKTLVSLYFTDRSKLEIAKYAYDYCIDKRQFFIVAEELFTSSSKAELLNYIQSK